MKVRVLGPLEVEGPGDEPRPIGPRDRVTLSVLVLRRGQMVSAEILADALWRGEPPASWAKVVQGCVSRLRRMLEASLIATVGSGYRLAPGLIQLDADELEALLDEAAAYAQAGLAERAVVVLDRALGLWRGTPYPDLEEWPAARLEAARLAGLRLDAEDDRLDALLAAGRHGQVAVEAPGLVAQEPWRERRWASLALAQYRAGRQADGLATIRRARRAFSEHLGLDPGSALLTLEAAILAQDPLLAIDHDARVANLACPWRGLTSYGVDDHETFFGRSADTAGCVARLESTPLLVLAGPSGSGKSSLLKAGVVPTLRRRGHEVLVFTPGADPAAALATALATASTSSPVVCVDQLEEAFGRGDAGALLHHLSAYAVDVAPVIVTVRADRLPDLVADRPFADAAERGLVLVAPLAGEALREAIEEPARVAGLRLEPGLVELLLRDAEDQPGALPLLSHALSETWRRRDGALLTIDAYRDAGGISGAVAASADRVYDGLDDRQRGQLRWLMLRMADLGDHGEVIRQPVPIELANAQPDRARVIELLVRTRLVTSDRDRVELAHEAVVRAWPRLRAWLEEDRTGHRLWRHLSASAEEWDRLGRPPSELYTGVRLDAALEWVERPTAEPTPLEQAFLTASAELAESDREALARRAASERRQNRRLRGLLAGSTALLALVLVVGYLAYVGGRSARDERDTARHRSLVGAAAGLRDTNRATAALLAAESYRQRPEASSVSAMLGTVTDVPGFLGNTYLAGGRSVHAAGLPGGNRVAIATGTEVRVLDLDTSEMSAPFENPLPGNDMYAVLRASADGRRVAELIFNPDDRSRCGYYEALLRDDGRGCTSLLVWDTASGRLVLGPVVTPVSGGDVALNQDGSIVAVAGGYDGDVVTWDVQSGRLLGRRAGIARPDDVYLMRDTATVAFAGRERLFLGSMSGPVRELDARTLRVRGRLGAPLLASNQHLVVAGGLLVAVGDRTVAGFDLASGRRRWLASFADTGSPEPCPFFAVSVGRRSMYCGSYFGQLEERALDSGQRTGVAFDPQLGQVGDLIVADGGRELAAFSQGSAVVSRWRIDDTGPLARMLAPGMVSGAGYDPAGDYLLVRPRDGYVGQRVIDAETGETIRRVRGDVAAAWAGDGVVAVVGADRAFLLDAATGRRVTSPVLDERTSVVFPEGDGDHAWAAHEPRSFTRPTELRRFEVHSGVATGDTITVRGWPNSLSLSPDGSRLYVTAGATSWRTTAFGTDDLAVVAEGLPDDALTAYGAAGHLLGADYQGGVTQLDPDTLEPIAAWVGSRGQVSSLQFSADGRTLLQTAPDQTLQLVDTTSQTRLGGAIATSATDGGVEGWLRPDGGALVANTRSGVVEWSLDPADLLRTVCELAGRNLTRTEWSTYLGYRGYEETCPGYGSPR